MFKRLTSLALFLAMIFLLFGAVGTLRNRDVVMIEPPAGFLDLRNINFDDTIIYIHHGRAIYPNQLYSSADFALGTITEPVPLEQVAGDVPFGTQRIILMLPEGITYGIAGKSVMYSQELFINGKSVGTVGRPGDTKESTIQSMTYYTYNFTPTGGQTELIYQYANFNHKLGGGCYPIYIGKSENIATMNQKYMVSVLLIAGCLLTVFLFYFGMFLFYGKHRYFLWFALCCLLIAARSLFTDTKIIMLFFPELNWFFALGFEYISLLLIAATFTAYLTSLLPDLLNRHVINAFYGATAVFAGIVVFTEPRLYSEGLPFYLLIVAAMMGYTIIGLALQLKRLRNENVLLFLSTLVFMSGALSDILQNNLHWYFLPHTDMTQVGMMGFVFINMIALALQFSRTEYELSQTKIKERELFETNALLDQLNQLKTQFLANLTHEMQTPLTVMSLKAQTSEKRLKRGADASEVYGDLEMISVEAKRLSMMVSQVLSFSRIHEVGHHKALIALDEIIMKTAEIYRSILQAKDNQLILSVPKLPPIIGNADMLSQVFINLLSNASRHTKNGEISIDAACENNRIVVTVTDTGLGIPSELLPNVFNRYQTDGVGTGLGLPICKEIIESHGGTIVIEGEEGKGTKVILTLNTAGGM